jgi:hypothetical protein
MRSAISCSSGLADFVCLGFLADCPLGAPEEMISSVARTDKPSVTIREASFSIALASLNPSSYWATFWGNETWSGSKGYLAYFLSSTSIDIGPAGGLQNYTFSGINTIHFYDFVVNGTSLTVYVDGVSKGTTSISIPSGGLSTNGLYFGARHNNTGTSYTDVCPGTYYSMRVYKKPLDATTISTIFNAMRSTYGL